MGPKEGEVQSLKYYRKRQGRCFELAGIAMMEEPGAEKFTLVHGIIHGWIAHAWITLPDGRVYDPCAHAYFSASDYAEKYEAVPEVTYTQKEMFEAMSHARYWGAWHQTRGATQGRR
jgi:hypothetical protein